MVGEFHSQEWKLRLLAGRPLFSGRERGVGFHNMKWRASFHEMDRFITGIGTSISGNGTSGTCSGGSISRNGNVTT
jgi:hypothetical protein